VANQPNILLIVSDQERQRSWLPESAQLPQRQRLLDQGLEFTRYYTHSSPCSPSRATLFTGQYVPQHGVSDNVIFPGHRPLSMETPTLGHVLRKQGYYTAYLGKWHLALGSDPDMEAYGFGDWTGNDLHYMGWAGTGTGFDPMIADQASAWLDTNAQMDVPWFLTVAMVNPHDVMWFPIDQPGYREAHPEEFAGVESLLRAARWKDGDVVPIFDLPYDEHFDTLPDNFDDDLHTKPEVQRRWLHEQQHRYWGYIDPADRKSWLRHLDYYVKLHEMGDQSLGKVLDALGRSGCEDDTVVIYTSDHGDMCGSHGLRAKGPFLYEEIMNVPLYIKVPGSTTPGTRTTALASHVDLAQTIAGFGGSGRQPSMVGEDLSPLFGDPSGSVRDHVLFSQDSVWFPPLEPTRYAMRGFTDGRYKYARYYGIGGGINTYGQGSKREKQVDLDSPFEDHDHEFYDLQEDPGELVNLAMDRSRRAQTREQFERLLELESEFAPLA
jgi:arylsulfatase